MFRRIVLSVLTILLSSCASNAPDRLEEPLDPTLVARGEVLVEGMAACGHCHGVQPNPGSPLSGGQLLADRYGEVEVPNITSSKSGIGAWTVEQIVRLMRGGVRPDGERISTELHSGMEWMSDPDLLAVIGYLRSVPPVQRESERRELSFVDRNVTGFFDVERDVAGYVPDIERRYENEYGRYLVDHQARCGVCHNTAATLLSEEVYLGGGAVVKRGASEKQSPAITGSVSAGIGGWSEQEIVHYLKSGETKDGRIVDRTYCPINFYARAPDEDLVAIARYLKSQPQ